MYSPVFGCTNPIVFACRHCPSRPLKRFFFVGGIAGIQHISKQGMINTCHMHAYLVCPAGLKLKLHICVVTKAFKHLIMCDSRLSVFFSLIAIFLRSLGFLPMAPSMVPSSSFTLPQTMPTYIRLQLMVLNLFRYLYMAFIVLADNKRTGGVHVYAMHYTGPYFAVYAT